MINKIILYLISRNIDHLILLSSGLRQELKKLLPSGFKMSVINNFHFIPEYRQVPEKIPHQLLYLGSIDERKGFHDLLGALEIISGVGYQLKAAGSFLSLHFKHRVEEKIRTDSLRVEILGYIKGAEKIKLLEESSILVLPSYQEGLPIVILEAMASGCALITTKAGAIGEILDGNNTLFIEPGNIRNLASAITTLLSDETLRKKYQAHNLKQSRRYSFGNFCRNISDVYLSNNCLS